MIYKRDEEIILLVKRFEERTLPKAEWTHEAHLTVGLFYCYKNPLGVAKNLMSDGIYWLNDAHDTPNTESSGYHETLTLFWLKTISSFLERNNDEKSLTVLANELLVFYKDSSLPLRHYSRERLFSIEARLQYVEPDLDEFTLSMNNLLKETELRLMKAVISLSRERLALVFRLRQAHLIRHLTAARMFL